MRIYVIIITSGNAIDMVLSIEMGTYGGELPY